MSSKRAFRSLWSAPDAAMSLGCVGCFDLPRCGGQTIDGSGFNCLDHCCGLPSECQVVCPNSQIFADRIREVSGFDLETPRTPRIVPDAFPPYVPMLFHGSARANELPAPVVAMPLYRFFDRAAGCRFLTRDQVGEAFKVSSSARVILSGVAQDHEVERWWKLETKGRLKAIANLRRLDIAMVTTPNFSLMVDRPRWDDLHSMRRIAEVFHELVSEGQAAALHVNGRTQHDFVRWSDYIVAHPEVTHVAYEFTTGAANPARMLQHALWLIEMADAVGRRLGLILRGGAQIVPLLSTKFEIVFIDSSPFEKAQHRQLAIINADGQRRWESRHTPANEPIDWMLDQNIRVSREWFVDILPRFSLAA